MANEKLARKDVGSVELFAEEFCIMELEERTEFLAVDVIGLATSATLATGTNLQCPNISCPNTNCPCPPPPPPINLILCGVVKEPADSVIRTPISE